MKTKEPKRPFHILLVEDDEFDAVMAKKCLEREKINVRMTHAKNGQSAMDCLNQAESPDLILMDLGLPDIDGCDLIKSIRQRKDGKNIPIIVVSGRAKEDMAKLEAELGSRCVQKWLDSKDLKNLVKTVKDYRENFFGGPSLEAA